MICIGPDIVCCHERSEPIPGVEFTGFAMEFASAEWHFLIPIYRRINTRAPFAIGLDDLVFHESHLRLDVYIWESMTVTTPAGKFVPLCCLVYGIYSNFDVGLGIAEFLQDICRTLRINSTQRPNHICRPEITSTLMRSLGFAVTDIMPYGRRVIVTLSWKFSPEGNGTGNEIYEHVVSLEFRPTPERTLRAAKWNFGGGLMFTGLLCELAQKHCESNPMQILSAEGIAAVLDAFEWTPLARMTQSQAKQARIEFIRNNDELVGDLQKLALALKAEGLYSPNTTPSQIVKSLPKLIVEMKSRKSL